MKINFRSLTYRSGRIYNFVNHFLYDWKKKFATIAKLVGYFEYRSLSILDLSCGTGFLARFLHPSVDYEGWDLNVTFLEKIKKDWIKGELKPKKIKIRRKDIFDFEDYPKEKKDVIVFSSILHHIYPRHIELVENAKKHARKIVICEPYAVKPKDITAHDWTAKGIMFFVKFFPERIYKYLDLFLADNDGINTYDSRSAWTYNKEGLANFYKQLGIKKIFPLVDELIGVWYEKK